MAGQLLWASPSSPDRDLADWPACGGQRPMAVRMRDGVPILGHCLLKCFTVLLSGGERRVQELATQWPHKTPFSNEYANANSFKMFVFYFKVEVGRQGRDLSPRLSNAL